ncbi:ADP-ribosylation factor-like protein 8A [Gurleya vavrai]
MSKICNEIQSFFRNFYKKLFVQKCRILFVGLENSGKTALISAIFENKFQNKKTPPRISISKFDQDNFSFFCYDIPGSKDQRGKWDHYYKKCDLLIFTLDSNANEEQIKESKDELQGLLYRNTWLQRSLLVCCTKNDLENAMTCKDVILNLDLTSLQNNDVSCFSISSKNKINLDLVNNWLKEQCAFIGKKKH